MWGPRGVQEAQLALLPIKKDVKQCSKELQETLTTMEATLNMTLARAERENATVYLQRVPKAADLPAIQPSPLVKSLPPTDLDASGETLFQSVIPDNRCSPGTPCLGLALPKNINK